MVSQADRGLNLPGVLGAKKVRSENSHFAGGGSSSASVSEVNLFLTLWEYVLILFA